MPVGFYTRNEHRAEDEPDEGTGSVWSALALVCFLVAFMLCGAWLYRLALSWGW